MPLVRQSVVLRHIRRADTHYDWLIESPDQPVGRGKLVAFRAPLPPEAWLSVGVIPLQRLPDHRRLYLTHQGPLPPSDDPQTNPDRGRILRIASGKATIDLWTPSRAVVRLKGSGLGPTLHLELRAAAEARYTAVTLCLPRCRG